MESRLCERSASVVRDRGEKAMEIILPLVVLFAIWVLVIWGSTYFNKNVT